MILSLFFMKLMETDISIEFPALMSLLLRFFKDIYFHIYVYEIIKNDCIVKHHKIVDQRNRKMKRNKLILL